MIFDNFGIQEINRQVLKNEKSIEELSQYLPCYLHVNSLTDFSLLEADSTVLEYFDLNKDEINMKGIELLEETVNPQDLSNAIKETSKYLNDRHERSHVSFLQRLSFQTEKDELLFYTRGKILDHERILNMSVPVQDLKLFNHNALKLFDNAAFIKSNIHSYNLLTNREILICKYLCSKNSIKEIASELNVSIHTIKNHKINIYKKLRVKNYFSFYFFCSKFKLND